MKKLSIIALVLSALIATYFVSAQRTKTVARTQQLEPTQSRLQVAEAMFQERCKTAGEKIHKTVDNVEGIL